MIETILFQCPACNGRHALCWMQRKSSRALGVICSHVARKPKFVPLPQSKIDQMDESELDKIPVHHTAPAIRQSAEKSNLQFVLMNVNPGETVERAIELPGFKESDEAASKRLLTEINQRTQAQKELSALIEKAARQRIELENEERELRHKLREIYTEPLNLK